MEIQSAGNSRSSILSATDVLWGFFYKEMIACNPGADEELMGYLFILKSLNLIKDAENMGQSEHNPGAGST